MNKLIVILGPTASGKTDLSIRLAKKFNGEVVSADSRQVYKGLNIGSGKITKSQMQGIPHHLLDVANPKRRFTVAKFQRVATKKIQEIQKRQRLPFLVGGTGFYLQSVVDRIVIPEVKPDWKLRKKLQKKGTTELYQILKKLDPRRAKVIDPKNPARLIRAIEIVLKTGKPVPAIRRPTSDEDESSDVGRRMSLNILQIGIKKSKEELQKAINKRLLQRFKIGMIAEVKKLHNPPADGGLSWKRLEELGLEYRLVAQYLQDKLSYQEMVQKLQKEIEHFASRQRTWFKRDNRIKWVTNYRQALTLIKDFLDGR